MFKAAFRASYKVGLLLLLAGASYGQSFVRVILGSGAPYTDSMSSVWQADTGCSAGTQYTVTTPIAGTADPYIYQHGRRDPNGFGCTYSVSNYGYFTVTLKFANTGNLKPGQQIFNVFINNVLVGANVDIAARSLGNVVAFDLGWIVPISSSTVNIVLSQVTGGVQLSAIDIEQYTVSIIGGGTPAGANGAVQATNGSGAFTDSGCGVASGYGQLACVSVQTGAAATNSGMTYMKGHTAGGNGLIAVDSSPGAPPFLAMGHSSPVAGGVWTSTTTVNCNTINTPPSFPGGAVCWQMDWTPTAATSAANAIPVANGSGRLDATWMPAYTGDATSPAGATALTLATVNSSPGSCGDATHSCQITANAKGLVTSMGNVGISGGGGGGTPGISAQRSTAQSLADNTPTAITFDTNVFGTGALHSTSTNPSRFIANATGVWVFSCGGGVSPAATVEAHAYKNGSNYATGNIVKADYASFASVVAAISMAPGDYAECVLNQRGTGSSQNTFTGADMWAQFYFLASSW